MNPDLAKERENCPFSKEEVTNLLDGGPEKTRERRDAIKQFLQADVSGKPNSMPASKFVQNPVNLYLIPGMPRL